VASGAAQAGLSWDSATSVWAAQVPERPVALLVGQELLVRPALQGPRKQLEPSLETWWPW
jgi:hypothetical protein